MSTTSDIENEIKSWLIIILEKEKVKNLSVNIIGNSEKGDGYVGDIVFVNASGINEDGTTKEYNLVLKCSKRSVALRKRSSIKEIFANEIHIYENVLPAFTQFQLEKGIENTFSSFAKCYGSFTSENMEVIAFENLKRKDYYLWDKRKPLLRQYIDLVVSEYGKLHAISVAMGDQKPEVFEKHIERFKYITDGFKKSANDNETLFKNLIDEIHELLKNDLDEDTLTKWKNLKQEILSIFNAVGESKFNVIVHGDCWNNNFMYYSENNDINEPTKVAILDWQVSRYTTPIIDLSCFLFTCISEEDLDNLNEILRKYYESFSYHLRKLGNDPVTIYTFDQLIMDWNTYCKFGVLISSLIHKVCSTEKDEVVDVAQAADEGKNFGNSFDYEIKDKRNFRKRIMPIVKYAVTQNLI